MTFIINKSTYNEYIGTRLNLFLDNGYNLPPTDVFLGHDAYVSFRTLLKEAPARSFFSSLLSLPVASTPFQRAGFEKTHSNLATSTVCALYLEIEKASNRSIEYRADLTALDISGFNTNAKLLIGLYMPSFIMSNEQRDTILSTVSENIDIVLQCIVFGFMVKASNGDSIKRKRYLLKATMSFNEDIDKMICRRFDELYHIDDFDQFVSGYDVFPTVLKESENYEFMNAFKVLS